MRPQLTKRSDVSCLVEFTPPLAGAHKRRSFMNTTEPLYREKKDYQEIVERISVANSPVGIDAQYTHAIIITYLREILSRVKKIETALEAKQKS